MVVKNIGIGTGRRKTSVARVYIREGKGAVTVNNKNMDDYFATPEQVQITAITRASQARDGGSTPLIR